jgi:VWFA-related protein
MIWPMAGRSQQVRVGVSHRGAIWPGPGMDPSKGRISIDVTVTNAAGKAVGGLTEKDFRLLDNAQPSKIITFEAEDDGAQADSDPPVSMVLVIDEADLSHANAEEARETAERYLRRNGGRLARLTTVYRSTAGALFATESSMNGNSLAEQLGKTGYMRTVWANPMSPRVGVMARAMLEGMSDLPQSTPKQVSMPMAMKALGAIAIEQRRVPGRKLLFWIGPGWRVERKKESEAFDTITEFSTRLRESRVEISVVTRWVASHADTAEGISLLGKSMVEEFAKGVKTPQDAEWGNLALQVLAADTGGAMLTSLADVGAAQEDGDIGEIIDRHVEQASHYYRLSFDPPHTGRVDDYRDVKVELDRPDLTAHTITGYYNEPVFYDDVESASEHATVAQLEQRLKRRINDREMAAELRALKMTERVSSARLTAWLARMPGERSREALTALADRSAFLDLPAAADLAAAPAPDAAQRRMILTKAGEYLSRELPRLPNFYANRLTTQYGEPPPNRGQVWKRPQADRRLSLEKVTRARVLFQEHKEIAEQQAVVGTKGPVEETLDTSGTFGPILVEAMKRASQPGSVLEWNRWEQGANGPVAVFDFNIAANLRGFDVGFCCLAIDSGMVAFEKDASFRGEVAIDPETGHILRLMVEAKLEPRLPLQSSGIVVEYGPVQMGGSTYFCPLRSISMSRQRRLWEIDEWGMTFKVYGPFKTVLNDVRFENYHLFRSESHMLPDYVPVPEKQ